MIRTDGDRLFALPAIWSIDTFGRRNLLLFGLPCMGLMLFWAGSMFFMDSDNAARVPVLALGTYRHATAPRVCSRQLSTSSRHSIPRPSAQSPCECVHSSTEACP
jgi:hypothetical protein